jgi:uncharacterized protein (TIGR02266 family)
MRRSGRVGVAMDVRVTAAAGRFNGTSANLSTGGLFPIADQLSRVGEELLLAFRLPGLDEELNVRAEVRWIRGDTLGESTRPSGMGLRFMDLPSDEQLTLRDFVRAAEDIGHPHHQ